MITLILKCKEDGKEIKLFFNTKEQLKWFKKGKQLSKEGFDIAKHTRLTFKVIHPSNVTIKFKEYKDEIRHGMELYYTHEIIDEIQETPDSIANRNKSEQHPS